MEALLEAMGGLGDGGPSLEAFVSRTAEEMAPFNRDGLAAANEVA